MNINFENLFEEKILIRGYNYFLNDAVHNVTKNGKYYNGVVDGTQVYNLQIKIDDNGTIDEMHCNCPYALENNCKHMAAFLFYIRNNGDVEKGNVAENAYDYSKILNQIPETEIKEFILSKIYENFDFQNEFRSHFVQYFEKTSKDVYERRIAQSIYYSIGKNGFIEYNETDKFFHSMCAYIIEAENLIKHNEYQAPFWIASLILERLPNLPIDDSDGTTYSIENECVSVIEKILEKCQDDNIKNDIFNWIIESIKNNELTNFTGGISAILDEYFIEDKYLKERLIFVNNEIQKLEQQSDRYSEYYLEDLIEQKISLLYELNMDDEALKTIKANIDFPHIRKMLIDIEKANGNINKVEKLLKDGIKIELKRGYSGLVSQYIENLLMIYKEQHQKEEYKSLVEDALFKYDKGSFKYYKKLKELYSEEQWKDIRDNIITTLENDSHGYYRDDLRKIYIEEQYYEKLYHSVMTTPLFEILVSYEKYLKKDFENELLEEYKKIADEKSKFTGRKNYEEIRKILQHMKTLKNGEKLVKKMVIEYKIRYANRRLMLEELEKV